MPVTTVESEILKGFRTGHMKCAGFVIGGRKGDVAAGFCWKGDMKCWVARPCEACILYKRFELKRSTDIASSEPERQEMLLPQTRQCGHRAAQLSCGTKESGGSKGPRGR